MRPWSATEKPYTSTMVYIGHVVTFFFSQTANHILTKHTDDRLPLKSFLGSYIFRFRTTTCIYGFLFD